MFISDDIIRNCGWQAFERIIARLLIHRQFSGVRVVGGSGDKGADILAVSPTSKRWLIQAKYWSRPVPTVELQRTIEAGKIYRAEFLVVVALNGVDEGARDFQRTMQLQGLKISVWSPVDLIRMAEACEPMAPVRLAQGAYQESAIAAVEDMIRSGSPRRSLVVMATGLGKTFVAAEAIRRVSLNKKLKILVLCHSNQLLLQLEKAFWPFLSTRDITCIWNQSEKPSSRLLEQCAFVFASRDTLNLYVNQEGDLPKFDLVVIDEAHHAHCQSVAYGKILEYISAGSFTGPQLIGLTATPFLADGDARLEPVFGDQPLVSIDMIFGLRNGYLAQIDYRLFTDNINWDGLKAIDGHDLNPRSVNRLFFIKEWDDGIIQELRKTWLETPEAKAIVFCGAIEHALLMKDKLNAVGFCRADAIYSGSARGVTMSVHKRNLMLADFEAGIINVMCTVDVFNEGIDVPDVNIVVFNRVTHSRRIFVQQLGRGLRIAAGKRKTIVLDFAQDIRRFAAGLHMKSELNLPAGGSAVSVGHSVVFRNAAGTDTKSEAFLRAWLSDAQAVELSGDDDIGILKFPPALSDWRS